MIINCWLLVGKFDNFFWYTIKNLIINGEKKILFFYYAGLDF